MAGKGGARPGSGRKSKEITALRRSFASDILSGTIEKNRFRDMLNSKDERIVLDALKYLADHKYGKAVQAVVGDGENPLEVLVRHIGSGA